MARPPRALGEGVLICFSINAIMGSGFLGMPASFYAAGWALALGALFAISVCTWAAVVLLVSTIARANALLHEQSVTHWLTPSLHVSTATNRQT